MNEKQFDAFLSFAFEDKAAIAEPLAFALKEKGLNIWFSSLNLSIGDSITDEINKGLVKSNYGIVILSPTYFQKAWAMAELKALFALETADKKKRILPIWHNLSLKEVQQNNPLIADRYAVSTELPIYQIVDKLYAVIKGEEKDMGGVPPAADSESDEKESDSKGKKQTGQYIDNRGAEIGKQTNIHVEGDGNFHF